MKSKLIYSIMALTLVFSACNNELLNKEAGSMVGTRAGEVCFTTNVIQKSDYDKSGTEYKGSTVVKIADGITFESKSSNFELKFSATAAAGSITIFVKNGNVYTAYKFDAMCMQGQTYVFLGKNVSGIKYGKFEAAPQKPEPKPEPEPEPKPEPKPEPGKMRLRGAMIGLDVGEADIRVLGGDWGANHIRWQLLWNSFPNGPADTASIQSYRNWLEREYQRLERLLPVCEALGMYIAIDLHTPPGGRDKDSYMPLFKRKDLQDEFLRTWEVIATRFKNQKAVWAYDLLNEACIDTVYPGLMGWQELATAAAKKIRAIDPNRPIIVEPDPWGTPASMKNLKPLVGVDNIIYSVHMYDPQPFTFQGYNEYYPFPTYYPGNIYNVWTKTTKYWDKTQLRNELAIVRDFQLKHNVPIYIGEFSTLCWTPGNTGYLYLKDLIEIFEEYEWNWAYHAFREWSGWSVEHYGTKPNEIIRATTPTDRQLLLMEYYKLGRK